MFRRSRRLPGLAASRLGPGRASWFRRRRPDAVIGKLRDTYVAAVADPVVRQKLIDAGAEPLQSAPARSPTIAARKQPNGPRR